MYLPGNAQSWNQSRGHKALGVCDGHEPPHAPLRPLTRAQEIERPLTVGRHPPGILATDTTLRHEQWCAAMERELADFSGESPAQDAAGMSPAALVRLVAVCLVLYALAAGALLWSWLR